MKYCEEEHKWLVNLYIKNDLEYVKSSQKQLSTKIINDYFILYNNQFSNNRKYNSFVYWCRNLEYLVFFHYFEIKLNSYEHASNGLKKVFNEKIKLYEANKFIN